MKKLLPILIIGVVVLSGLAIGSPANTKAALSQPMTTTTNLSFSQPVLQTKEGYLTVSVTGSTTLLQERNKPVLPLAVKTVELPYGSTNVQFTCTPNDVHTMTLDNDIIPALVYTTDQTPNDVARVKDPDVYASSQPYPATWYTTNLGAGRNANLVEVIFATIICNPVRYTPATHELTYTSGFTVTLTYTPPSGPAKTFSDPVTMVVIGPKKFQSALQPLVDEKNQHGVVTVFKAAEDIMSQYNGTDPPEKIKLYLKDMFDQHNITYVLLAGGLKNYFYDNDKESRSYGAKAWWVPVRYVSIPEDSDHGTICDLYYGCLYNGTGGFDSWDSNHDGVYGAWQAPGAMTDHFDMYPEVFYGRLAASTVPEMKSVVKKLVNYETSSPKTQDWFKNVIGVGGKTFAYYEGMPDGEWLCTQAIENLSLVIPGINPIHCFTTNRDIGGPTPRAKDIIPQWNKGASFIDFEGHGNPDTWDTIWFDGTYPVNWTGGIHVQQFWKINNGNKYPFVIVGGCHNGLFNVSMIPCALDAKGARYYAYGFPLPCCFSWGLISKGHGGAIGSTGDTGFGFGAEDNPNTMSAALENNFFYVIGHNNTLTFGASIGGAVRKYIGENVINKDAAFCITDFQFFGDPSLVIGGY